MFVCVRCAAAPWSGAVFPKIFCSRTPFWIGNITTGPHIIGHVNIVWADDRYQKLKMYISEQILDRHKHIGSTRDNASHDLTLIKTTVACFVGTGNFLI